MSSPARRWPTEEGMKRGVATLIGLVILGGAVVLICKLLLKPPGEEKKPGEEVLTREYLPRVTRCAFLEDAELPEGVGPLEVGEEDLYLSVVVLYPNRTMQTKSLDYRLERINGLSLSANPTIPAAVENTEEGLVVRLVYRVDREFEYASLALDGKPLLERIALQQ